jgi:hypothetical protein
MRPILLLVALSLSSVSVEAREPATEVIVAGGPIQIFKGTLSGGDIKSFLIRPSTARTVNLTLDSTPADCGVEMQTSSQPGYASEFSRFPTTRSMESKEGETFKLSFYLMRAEWVSRGECSFSLSIE